MPKTRLQLIYLTRNETFHEEIEISEITSKGAIFNRLEVALFISNVRSSLKH